MGVGSLKVVQKLTNKVNTSVGRVMTSKAANSVFGGLSQALRRFPTPADVANLPDPLKSFQWEVMFPNISISIGAGSSWLPYQPICENISFTLPKIDSIDLNLGPSKVHMAKSMQTATQFSADFYCDNNAMILSYYQEWRRMAVHDDQLVGFPDDYKKYVYLYLLGVRSVIPVYLIKFKGVYPTEIKQMSLKSSAKADRITSTITFNCDLITAEPLATGQIATGITNNIIGNALSNFGSANSISSLFTKGAVFG